MDEAKKITATDMEKYLAERYSDSYQWVFLTQVRSSTGSASRIADAMAFNMYGSTGYEILGFEIKVSRSDWLSELKNMAKSNEIMEYCDKWYLVVPDADIVKDGELPKNWGLLVLKDGKLVQKVRAMATKTTPMELPFIASLLRRSANEIERIRSTHIKREDIAEELKKARDKGYEDARGYNGKQTEESLKKLREQVFEFEKASGISFDEWRGKQYAKTLGTYIKLAMDLSERTLEYDIRHMESAIASLQRAIVDVKKIKKTISENE